MAIRKIARMGHPVLRRPAAPVHDPRAPEIRQLIADMVETMEDADGAGLAAPQVHVGLRVVMFHVPADRQSASLDGSSAADDSDDDGGDDGAVPLTVLINPVVEPLDSDTALGWEGCLSVPGLMGAVPRWRRVRYRGLDPDGKVIEREAEGFHARVVQHECDHLDGILYPQRMSDLSLLLFAEETRHGLPDLPSDGEDIDVMVD
ncbi:MAG: peptide deformylase [Alphaproteobacteria bacterium]